MNSKRILLLLPSLCLFGGVLLLFPAFRQWIIEITMQFITRREFSTVKWSGRLLQFAKIFIFLSSMTIILYILMERFSIVKKTVIDGINELVTYNYRKFASAFFFMFALYTLGIVSIIRANFSYSDDLGRSITGNLGWLGQSRYLSNVFGILLHANVRINDISPLNQLLAAAFVAAASVIVVNVVSGGKASKLMLFASLPIGLSPWFLGCFSFKFDSSWMALSVLASVFPFLFIRNYFLFSACSIISLWIMSMTYQVSSGIYILVVIAICLKQWNEGTLPDKEIFKFAAVSAASYCAAMILFRAVFMAQFAGYVNTDVYPASQMFSGIFYNLSAYIDSLKTNIGFLWKTLLLLSGIMFLVKTVLYSKRNKGISLLVSLLAIILMFVLSFGVYLFLQKPLFGPRSMYSLGVFIAILGICSVSGKGKVFAVPALVLCWCFFVFSFSYGNVLAEQKRYIDFRVEMLMHDLSILFPARSEKAIPIRIKNSAGYTPVINNIAAKNPIIKQLVPVYLEESIWTYEYLADYFNFNLQDGHNLEDEGLELLLDTYYHTIKAGNGKIFVIIKQ